MAKAYNRDGGGGGGSAALRDIYLRHGINLTRYSTHEARKLVEILDTANKQIRGIISKAKGIETKEKYRRIASEIRHISKELSQQLNGQVQLDFTKLAEEETRFVESAVRNVGLKTDFELPAPTKIWATARFDTYVGYGKDTYESFLDTYGDNVFKTWDSQVRAGYMAGLTAKQINRNVLGSVKDFEPGQMQALRRSLETNTRTMVAHLAETARNETYRQNSRLFSGYRYLGTLDSRTCLEKGQLIETPLGNRKIESINIGDYVIGGSGEARKVIGKFSDKRDDCILTIELSNGKEIRCTRDHEFLIGKVWKEAAELLVREKINDTLHIKSIKKLFKRTTVYDITVDIDHSFKVFGCVLHNCLVCGELDGKKFQSTDEPDLPQHPNCRCLYLPCIKGMEDFDDDDERASADGPVSASMTYEDWLKTQPENVQRDILGPTRFDLYKEGMPITSFVANGSTLNLQQLSEKEGLELFGKEPAAQPNFEVVSDEMREKLQEQSNAFYKTLTEEQYKSIYNYSDTGYTDINDTLYGNIPATPEIEAEIKTLDGIIGKSETQSDLIVYKGSRAEFYKDWNINETHEREAYYSTTVSKNAVKEFLVEYKNPMTIEIMVPKGTKALYLGTNSSLDDEDELLLNRGLKYKVLEKEANFMKLLVL